MTGMPSPMKGKELTPYVWDDTADAVEVSTHSLIWQFRCREEAHVFLTASGFDMKTKHPAPGPGTCVEIEIRERQTA